MKIFASYFVSLFGLVVFLTQSGVTYAREVCPGGNFSNLCDLRLEQSSGIVGGIVNILLVLAVVLALIFLIWGGVRWISSGGDKGKIDSARSTIVAAIVGLILAFLAYFFVNILAFFFTGQSFTSLTIPTLLGN